ncbi:MAG: iron ABC transporter permease [Clostridia bacterium]|nr:iron ABC transporter permease [Clostridia bacterium]
MRSSGKTKWIAAAGVAVAIFLLSICAGRFPLSPGEIAKAILQRVFGVEYGLNPAAVAIVVDNRLPRTMAGALVGAALAASGCAFQGLFQNPLVSQGVLGVSSGAGFGAALSILLFSGTAFVPGFAFVFALAAVWLSFMVARMCGEVTPLMLVLGGTIISSIFSALLSFLKYVADPYNQLASIVFWNMGSLASVESSLLPFGAAVMLVGMAILCVCAGPLNVLSMGDREAKSMGLPVLKTRILIVSGATLATAGAVSIAGTVAWVGLVIPHIARFLIGSDNRKLVPFSILLGAAFMMLVDLLCRTVTGSEIPLGILTSLLGGPFFIYLLRRYKGGGWK